MSNWGDKYIKDAISETERDNWHNTLDDLIQGLQELRNKYGNIRVVTDYDCHYAIDPLTIDTFRQLKDDNGKVTGLYIMFG